MSDMQTIKPWIERRFVQRRRPFPRPAPFYVHLNQLVALSETCTTWIYAIARLNDIPIGEILSWDASTLASAVVVYRWDCIITDAHRIVQTPHKERGKVRAEIRKKGTDGLRAIRLARRLLRRGT